MYLRSGDGPGPHFEDNLRAHLDDRGVECPPVGCVLKRPDIERLTAPQLAYYLYWRDRILDGEYIEADCGYIFLLLSEILVRDLNPSEVGRICDRFLMDRHMYHRELVSDFLFDYLIVHGLDPYSPTLRLLERERDIITCGALTNVLANPQSGVPPFILYELGYLADMFIDDDQAQRIALDLAKALTAVGDLFARRGTGILEEIGEGRRTHIRGVFFEYPTYHGERAYVLDNTDLDLSPDGRAGRFLAGLIRLCVRVREEMAGEKGTTVPGHITKDIRNAVKAAITGRSKVDVSSETVPDLIFRKLSDHVAREDVLKVPMFGGSNCTVSGSLRDDVHRYAGMAPSGPHMDYVPSRLSTPEYSKLKDGRLEYYLQWREGVRHGEYGRTDEGYIWLLMTELLNTGVPQESMDMMMKVREVYDPYHCDRGLGQGILMRALVNGLDIPSTDLDDRNPLCIGKVLAQIDKGGTAEITLGSFDWISYRIARKPVAGFDRACARAMNVILRDIAERRAMLDHRDGSTTFGFYLRNRIALKNDTPFRFYGFPGKDRSMTMHLQTAEERYLCEDLRGLMADCADLMQAMRAGRTCKIKHRSFGRVNVEAILVGAIRNEIRMSTRGVDGMWVEVRRTVELDREAVDNAERDLEQVTDMMRVEDPGDGSDASVEEEREVVHMDGDGQWARFSVLLTDDEMAYLRSMFDGGSRADVRLDDSINAKAMDTIGDTVVEGGCIVADYRSEIEGCVADSPVPMPSPDPISDSFLKSLTEDELGYLRTIASGRPIRGRRPVRRIESINAKSEAAIGRHVISDGTMDEQILEIIIRMKGVE